MTRDLRPPGSRSATRSRRVGVHSDPGAGGISSDPDDKARDILTQQARELVIERALALDTPFITEEELKWIVLLVLMNQPGQETAFARMEDMVYNDIPLFLH